MCGRIQADGSICGASLRVTRQRDCKQHIYSCRSKTAGGCSGLGRRGDKVDEFISEAVLAKLEERSVAAAQDVGPWPGADDLSAVEVQIKEFREKWRAWKISNALFFGEIPALEAEQSRLRAERKRYALSSGSRRRSGGERHRPGAPEDVPGGTGPAQPFANAWTRE
jgi:hypothetical protein